MSGPLSLLRHRNIFRHRCPLQGKMLWGCFAFWISLALAPLSVLAQTVPVTIVVTTGTPLGSSGGGSLAVASLSAAGLTSGLVFSQLVMPVPETLIESASARRKTTPGLLQGLPGTALEMREETGPEFLQRPRTIGAMFRYE